MNTLLLDQKIWDLCLDVSGNIAVASDPYSVAQDVASACRVFQGEAWFDTTLGVPYFQQILGRLPPIGVIKAQLAAQAALVPGCNNPVVFITGFQNRMLTGQVQFTDDNAQPQAVNINALMTKVPLMDSSGNIIYDSQGNPLFGS
jgi:hypothetical protein